MSNPLISIVMPAFNNAKYLPESILSVMEQSYANWELLIVDDGSTDNTSEIIDQYLRDTRIRYIKQSSQGPASARNRGVMEASGEYIALLDSDDIWAHNKLELQNSLTDGDNSIVMSSIIRFQAELTPNNIYGQTDPPDFVNHKQYLHELISLDDSRMANFTSALIPKVALIEVGLYDTQLNTAEDWDLWLRLAATLRYRFTNVLQPLVFYRKHPKSLTRSYHFTKTFINQLCVLDKIQKCNIAPSSVVKTSKIEKHDFFFGKALHHGCIYEASKIWLSALRLPYFYTSKHGKNLLKWPVKILLAIVWRK